VLVVCLAAFASALSPVDEFNAFQAKFGKKYGSAHEETTRFAIFQQNLARAAALNEQARAAGLDTVHGVTKFMDLTPEEFAQYKGYQRTANSTSSIAPYTLGSQNLAAAPTSYDWRTHTSVVSPVKDQGNCGSCWAFSATEQIESNLVLAGNKQQILSPQQIVSCDLVDAGCGGGDTPTAYNYVKGAGGLMTEAAYPYVDGGDTDDDPPRRACKFSKAGVVAKITGFAYGTTKNDETTMAANLAAMSPFSICVATNGWQTYSSGILGAGCGGAADVDHCVQVVGFNDNGAKPYWIVRNSWNTDWGVDGYIYVQKGINACDIAGEVTYVTGASP